MSNDTSTKKWCFRIVVGRISGKPEVIGPFPRDADYLTHDDAVFGDDRFAGSNYRWFGPLQTIEVSNISA